MKEITAPINLKTILKKAIQNIVVIFIQIIFLAIPLLFIKISFFSFIGLTNANEYDIQINKQEANRLEIEYPTYFKTDRIDEDFSKQSK